jgi:hypothetical protein
MDPAALIPTAFRPRMRRGQEGTPEYMSLGEVQIQMHAGEVAIPPHAVQPERHFFSPEFVAAWEAEMLMSPFIAPILMMGAVAALRNAEDHREQHVITPGVTAFQPNHGWEVTIVSED